MKQSSKKIIVSAVGIAVALIAASSVLSGYVYDKQKKINAQHVNQIRESTRYAVQLQNEFLFKDLLSELEQNLSDGENFESSNNAIQNPEKFVSLGLFNRPNASTQRLDWDLFRNNSIDLNKSWFEAQIQRAPLETIQEKMTYWLRVEGPNQQVYFMVLGLVEYKKNSNKFKKIAVGVLPHTVFSTFDLLTKGSQEQLFLVNSQGYTMSYPESTYVGAKFDSHPMVQELLKNQSNQYESEFRISGGEKKIGGYSRVNLSNIYVVTSSSYISKIDEILSGLIQVSILGVVIIAMTSGLIYLFSRKENEQIFVLTKNLQLFSQNTQSQPTTAQETSGAVQLDTDFAKAVAQMMQAPVHALMGYVQMVGNDSKNKKELISRIQVEARKLRDFIELLTTKFSSTQSADEKIEIQSFILNILEIVKSKVTRKNIEVISRMSLAIEVRAQYSELKNIIKFLIEFSVERMNEFSNNNKLLFDLVNVGAVAEIKIDAIGAIITDDERKFFFKPFAVKSTTSKIFDLDFALSRHYLQSLGGDIFVEKLSGEGIRYIIRIPTVSLVHVQSDVVLPLPPLKNRVDS